MDTAEVLRRALHATAAGIDPGGVIVIGRRISCIHDAQAELAGLLAGEVGEADAVASLRLAATRANTALIADYLNGAADLLDPGTTTAAPVTPGTADPTSTASSTSPEGTS